MAKELQRTPVQLVPTTGSLETYIQFVNRLPVPTAEEERELAHRYREHEDLEAARQLVLSNLRYVVRIARGYRGYGLPEADLIQEGNIGLMKAVKRFDPGQGVRLMSFAVHWIRAEIHEYILRNWRIVKVATTKAQRKLFFNLRSAKKRLGWMNNDEVENVAKELGVTPESVTQMEGRLSYHDVTFDAPVEDDEDNPTLAPSQYLTDEQAEPGMLLETMDSNERARARLREALSELDERSRQILQRRWLAEPKATLQQLADEYGVSAERVRQLERNAIKKLRRGLEDLVEAA